MARLKGNGGGKNGENTSYTKGNGQTVSRPKAVKDTERGLNPDYHVIKVNNVKYVRANPNGSSSDNVD